MTRDLDLDLDVAPDLNDLYLYLDLDAARDLAHGIARACACEILASNRERHLVLGGDSAESLSEASGEDGWQPPGRAARGVVAVGLRILPVGSRMRYAEELRDELGIATSRGCWGGGRSCGTRSGSWPCRGSCGAACVTPGPRRRASREHRSGAP